MDMKCVMLLVTLSEILRKLFTRVAAQSWCVVVGTVVKIQRVPVMLCGKTHNLYLERQIKRRQNLFLLGLVSSESGRSLCETVCLSVIQSTSHLTGVLLRIEDQRQISRVRGYLSP